MQDIVPRTLLGNIHSKESAVGLTRDKKKLGLGLESCRASTKEKPISSCGIHVECSWVEEEA